MAGATLSAKPAPPAEWAAMATAPVSDAVEAVDAWTSCATGASSFTSRRHPEPARRGFDARVKFVSRSAYKDQARTVLRFPCWASPLGELAMDPSGQNAGSCERSDGDW